MDHRNAAALLAAFVLLAVQLPAWGQGSAPVPLSEKGKALARALDAMDVEHLWLAGIHVNWKTGEPDGKKYTKPGSHTHCSAFVAAACERLGVYILRPPEHGLKLLANAQYDWLREEGGKKGWREVKTAYEAQRLANQGAVVVAVYKSPNPEKSGHIALVRPQPTDKEQVVDNGPYITQAGMKNYRRTTLKEGFKHHRGAFGDKKIRFFAHPWSSE